MKRNARELAIMRRRYWEDVRKHKRWNHEVYTGNEECGCSRGLFRKRRPLGCYKGEGCICRLGKRELAGPTYSERRALADSGE